MNYTYYKHIESVFNDRRVRGHLSLLKDGYICACHDDTAGKEFVQALADVIKNEKKELEQREKIETLCKIFAQSHVQGVIVDKEKVNLSKPESTELEEAIYRFDYAKLREMKERNAKALSGKNADLYLQQATICSFLYEYETAYNCLSNAIDILYRKKDFARYYFALFSKRNIGKIILWDPFTGVRDDIAEKIRTEIDETETS